MKTNYEYGGLILFAFKNVKFMFVKYNQLRILNKLKYVLKAIHCCIFRTIMFNIYFTLVIYIIFSNDVENIIWLINGPIRFYTCRIIIEIWVIFKQFFYSWLLKMDILMISKTV